MLCGGLATSWHQVKQAKNLGEASDFFGLHVINPFRFGFYGELTSRHEVGNCFDIYGLVTNTRLSISMNLVTASDRPIFNAKGKQQTALAVHSDKEGSGVKHQLITKKK